MVASNDVPVKKGELLVLVLVAKKSQLAGTLMSSQGGGMETPFKGFRN